MKLKRGGKRQVTYYLPNSIIKALETLAHEDTRLAKARGESSIMPSHMITKLVTIERERRKNPPIPVYTSKQS